MERMMLTAAGGGLVISLNIMKDRKRRKDGVIYTGGGIRCTEEEESHCTK